MTRRARQRAAKQKEAERIAEIEEYFEATKNCPDWEFKVYGDFNTYLSHPKTVAAIRAALRVELENYYGCHCQKG